MYQPFKKKLVNRCYLLNEVIILLIFAGIMSLYSVGFYNYDNGYYIIYAISLVLCIDIGV